MDLILIIILTLILMPVALFTSGYLRIVLGLLSILFFPGYALITALFPKKYDLDIIERIAISFVLSIAIVSLIGLILNYTPWGISPTPFLISIASFIVITSVISLYRRRILPEVWRFEPKLRIRLPRLGGMGKMDKALTLMLALSIIGAIGTLAYVVATPKVGERFTEFYILGLGGTAGDYPRELALGEQGKVILGIVNREHVETTYLVEVKIEGDKVDEVGPISLAHEGKWEVEVAFTPQKAGENQKVEFLLFKGEKTEPYRRLHLWIDVKGAK